MKLIGLIALGLITGLMLVACGEATPAPSNAPAAVATATAAPTKAAAAPATNLGSGEANALYAGLQKTYGSKSFKVNGQTFDDTKKTSQNFEIVPGDRLHATMTAPDGKTEEMIIIGNSSFNKAAGGSWIKPQVPGTGNLRKQMNALGLIDPAQMIDQVKTKGATVAQLPDVQENGETLKAFMISFQSEYIPEGLPSGSDVAYYLDKNNMVKRIKIANIGFSADYSLSDYNTPLTIVAP